jgi:hypothetical protein
MGWSRASVQCPPIAFDSHRQGNGREECDLPELTHDLVQSIAFQDDAPDDAQEMRKRQDLAEGSRPHGHAGKREHELGEQQRGEKEKERDLDGLTLVLGDRRKRDADARLAAMNTSAAT